MLSLSSNAELSIIIIKYKPPQSKDFQGHLKLVESQLLSLYTIIHFFLWRIKQTWSMHTLCPEDVKLITIWGIVILEAEKAMATHSSTLAWKIPWMEEPGRLQSMGSWRVQHDWATSLSRIGEGNGNPLQCSCLENPKDGGAWWAAVCGVAQSRTQLKRLSSSSSMSSMYIYMYV